MKKLVIIPGGFHPFHAGHKALYDAAREAFPSADVYVAATADTATRPFPFEVKQKLARMAGIDGHRFIQVKSPFQAREITQHYDPNDTVLIFARSEKDRETQPQAGTIKKDGTAGYLQPYKRNGLEPMSKHGYMVYLPTVQFGPGMTSATEIRAKWPDMDPEQKTRLVNQMYPDTVQKIKLADVIVQMLDAVMGSQLKTDEGLGNLLSYAIPIAGNVAVGKHIYDILAKAKKPPAASPNSGPQIPPPPDSGSTWIDDTNESTVINDPEAGLQIRPAGGMGTWTEDSLRKNLAEKFAQMLTLLKTGQYDKIHDVLKQGSWVANMVRALAEYQAFQAQQGRRPMARGAEIDITDYVDEKRAGK